MPDRSREGVAKRSGKLLHGSDQRLHPVRTDPGFRAGKTPLSAADVGVRLDLHRPGPTSMVMRIK